MSRLLIRGGMSPFESFDAPHMIIENSIGSNVGNLVYAYSVARALVTDKDTTIEMDHYEPERRFMNDREIAEYDSKYDKYIIPLADAFRQDFKSHLAMLTDFIKRTKMEVIVIGAGIRAPYDININKYKNNYDKTVKNFIKAVLDKSAVVGLRGHLTEQYLVNMGFQRDSQVRAIGCPSLYTKGIDIKPKELDLTPDSKVLINATWKADDSVNRFLRRVADEYPDYTFVPQLLNELRAAYLGIPYRMTKGTAYPINRHDPVYKDDHVLFPLNVPSWLETTSKHDIGIGSRFHGNVASVLSGTPAIFIVKDARMREMCEYHHVVHYREEDISEKVSLAELVEKSDFQEVYRFQEENLKHYASFLDENGLDHIFKNSLNPGRVVFDEILEEVSLKKPVRFVGTEDIDRHFERVRKYVEYEKIYIKQSNKMIMGNTKRISALEDDCEKLKVKNKKLKKDVKKAKAKGLKSSLKKILGK